jgi:pimeloyl-ACP methyl ester carboxylesterase
MSTTFVLIPGAGGLAWYWHRVVPELRARGHEAITVDLPAGDDRAGLAEYADAVIAAICDRRGGLVLVAQSMGGLTAPLVCERVPVDGVVLVNAMTPKPGESPGEWWEATGQPAARVEQAVREGRTPGEFDPFVDFFHDVPPDVVAGSSSPAPPSGSHGRCRRGRTCPRGSSRAATTGSSRSSSSAGWWQSGCPRSRWRSCRAGI